MELINQYFIEIFALIIILTLLIIYAILKKPAKNTIPLKDITPRVDTKKVQKPKKESKELPDKPKEPTLQTKEEIVQTKKRTKRELVPHDKIQKNDFENFKGTNILVAEDNMINQKVITSLLSTSGINITIANDGQECIDILKQNNDFTLILMDAHMPILDGFQATRYIRKKAEYEHIPIIALSGDTAADDIKNMLNVGMEGHLEKPLKLDALYDILYIYTTGEEDRQSSSKVKSPSSEFNSEKGLSICGGDTDFFFEILNDFLSKYSDADKTLQDYLNNNNSTAADKMLLDISGVASNIGANNLNRAALELKNSIANPDDLEYISSLRNLKRSLIDVVALIKEYKAS